MGGPQANATSVNPKTEGVSSPALDPAFEAKFEEHVIRELIERSKKGAYFYLVVVAVFMGASGYWQQVPQIASTFMGVLFATCVWRIFLLAKYHELSAKSDWPKKALVPTIIAPAVVVGCLGFSPWYLFGMSAVAFAITLVPLGIGAAGTSSMGVSRRCHSLFLLVMMVPPLVGTLYSGDYVVTMGIFLLSVFLLKEGKEVRAGFRAIMQANNEIEKKSRELQVRNFGMQLLLDNVVQGFVTVNFEGELELERSSIFDVWFGGYDRRLKLVEHLEAHDPKFCDWFDMGLEQLRDEVLPWDMLIDQMPRGINTEDKTFSVEYTPIRFRGKIRSLLLVITDISELLESQRHEAEQRETLSLFAAFTKDRMGFSEFINGAQELMDRLMAEEIDFEEQARVLHTLKGNVSLFGVRSVESVCHELEDAVRESEEVLNEAQKDIVQQAWAVVLEKAESITGGERPAMIELEEQDYGTLVQQLKDKSPYAAILSGVRLWKMESADKRLERFGSQARALAKRLGKPDVVVEIEADGVRLDPVRWGSFWSAFTHMLRNAVDHGIEAADLRQERNKPEAGHIWLRAHQADEMIVVSVEDDGCGIDWDAVRQRAKVQGLPYESESELRAALFMPGFSTAQSVTEISGRGVGLNALASETERLGGHIEVRSEVGKGTRFDFHVPTRSA